MKLLNTSKVVVPIVLLVGFVILSKYEDRAFIRDIDFAVTVKVQDRMPARFDQVWEDISFFVSPIPSLVLVGLLTVAARKKRALVIIPLLFGLVIAGEVYGKMVVHHPSPPFFMIKNPTTIFPQHYVNEQFSYPSGHAARAVFVASVAWVVSKRKLWQAAVLTMFVLAVFVEKVYLGHHWVSDVVGGALLGSGLGLLTLPAFSHIMGKQ